MHESANILGVISGSSLDGLDFALCQFSKNREFLDFNLIAKGVRHFTPQLKNALSEAPKLSGWRLAKLDADFSQFCANEISSFEKEKNCRIDFISSHGHTVFHEPSLGFTTQIGNGGLMAGLTGITTISDFRINDIALGGQGAPIAPISEKLLFTGYKYYLNLGGIANISCHGQHEIGSFDSCPCNQLLNFYAGKLGQDYDKDGDLARQGEVRQELLLHWRQNEYFDLLPPKSLDNTWVSKNYLSLFDDSISIHDHLATSVEFITDQIVQDLRRHYLTSHENQLPEDTMFITGGGGHNLFLIEKLRTKCSQLGINIHVPPPEIIDYKEAILMSLMGYLRLTKQPNTIKTVTGASDVTIGGGVYIG